MYWRIISGSLPVSPVSIAVLTPGIYNSAYFEHAYLAQQMGAELVEGRYLVVKNDVVYMINTKGLQRVDIIYRRVDDDFIDPHVFRKDSILGTAGLLEAYKKGNVVPVNAPGTGVADDKAVFAYIPRIIKYYLGEDIILPNVHTYICAEESDLNYVLEHIGDLVVKQTDAGHDTLKFITDLTQTIHAGFTVESRDIGKPLDPAYTYELKRGSCRDLSWMLIHILRQSGIVSRFVSGYYYFNTEIPEFELHAWVKAYIPGAGWLGLDPSHGLLTAESHLALASSAFYENTMPVTGSSRGDATGSLHTNLNIEVI